MYFQELPGARYICRSDGAQVGYMDKKPCFVEPVPENEIQKDASPTDAVRTKKCSRCGRTLPVSEFRRSRTGAYYNVCKECVHDKHSATVKAQYAEKAAAEEEKKTKKAPKKAKVCKRSAQLPAESPEPAINVSEIAGQLAAFEDTDLIDELARRGWHGSLWQNHVYM